MTGSVTIKDSATTMFTFVDVEEVRHSWAVAMQRWDMDGDAVPAIDNTKTIVHTIEVRFKLLDKGAYSSLKGQEGSIWNHLNFLNDLANQPTNADYYTLDEDDDTVTTGGYSGVISKVSCSREQESQPYLTGSLTFMETNDVTNL